MAFFRHGRRCSRIWNPTSPCLFMMIHKVLCLSCSNMAQLMNTLPSSSGWQTALWDSPARVYSVALFRGFCQNYAAKFRHFDLCPFLRWPNSPDFRRIKSSIVVVAPDWALSPHSLLFRSSQVLRRPRVFSSSTSQSRRWSFVEIRGCATTAMISGALAIAANRACIS